MTYVSVIWWQHLYFYSVTTRKKHFVTQDCTIDMRALENTNIWSFMSVSILMLYLDLNVKNMNGFEIRWIIMLWIITIRNICRLIMIDNLNKYFWLHYRWHHSLCWAGLSLNDLAFSIFVLSSPHNCINHFPACNKHITHYIVGQWDEAHYRCCLILQQFCSIA